MKFPRLLFLHFVRQFDERPSWNSLECMSRTQHDLEVASRHTSVFAGETFCSRSLPVLYRLNDSAVMILSDHKDLSGLREFCLGEHECTRRCERQRHDPLKGS